MEQNIIENNLIRIQKQIENIFDNHQKYFWKDNLINNISGGHLKPLK